MMKTDRLFQLFFFILLSLAAHSGALAVNFCNVDEAKSANLLKYPKEILKNDKVVCLENTEDSLQYVEEELKESSNKVWLHVSDLTNLSINADKFSEIFVGKDFNLLVDGICSGECSRLLLPLASKTIFKDGSFAVLTDSAIKSRLAYYADSIINAKNNDAEVIDPVKMAAKIGADYQNKLQTDVIKEHAILFHSEVNVTHLYWNSFVSQSLKRSEFFCPKIRDLGVILTNEYFRENYIPIHRKAPFTLPSDDYIIKKFKSITDKEIILIKSYETEPLLDCNQS